MLKDDKPEFIVIASRHLLKKKAAVDTIRVTDCNVSTVSVGRNLGVWFDDKLTMADR